MCVIKWPRSDSDGSCANINVRFTVYHDTKTMLYLAVDNLMLHIGKRITSQQNDPDRFATLPFTFHFFNIDMKNSYYLFIISIESESELKQFFFLVFNL